MVEGGLGRLVFVRLGAFLCMTLFILFRRGAAAFGLLLAFCFLTGCPSAKKVDGGFYYEGKVTGGAVGPVLLKRLFNGEMIIVDSARADADGAFVLKGKLPQADILRLDVPDKKASFFLVGENKEMGIALDFTQPEGSISFTNSQPSTDLKRVQALEARREKELEPMRYELQLAAQNRQQDRVEKYLDYIARANLFFRGRFKQIIDSIGPGLPAYYAAAYNLDEDKDFGYLDSLSTKLTKALPGHPLAEQLASGVAQTRATAIGQPAPSFKLPALDGKGTLGPQDFKGKVLLIDFWASWCRPCLAKVPEMKVLYKDFKGRNVEFLGVSLDREDDAWRRAVSQFGLAWPQSSDLKFWDSEAARLYKITSIPAVFVIDAQGRIAGKNIDGEELRSLLTKLTTGA